MVNTRRVTSVARAGLALGAVLLGVASVATALTTTDRPASILVYPKIVATAESEGGIDTVIDISNSKDELVAAHCWLINANSHCASYADPAYAGKPCQRS